MDGLDYHCKAYVKDTYGKGQDHCGVVSCYLGREEYALDGGEYLPLGNVHGEERMEQESYYHCSYAKGDHKRGQVLEHLLQCKADYYQNQSVTGVSHAECEEQQEEYRYERGGVEAVVRRASVHVRKGFEHTDELVVAEGDGRILLSYCFLAQVEYVKAVKCRLYNIVLFCGRVAFKCDDGILRCWNGSCVGQGEIKLCQDCLALSLKLHRFCLQAFDAAVGGGNAGLYL